MLKSKRLKSKNGTPILPSSRQYQDPTKQGSKRRKAERSLVVRVKRVKTGMRRIIANIPKEKVSTSNSYALLRKESLFHANRVLSVAEQFYFNKTTSCCGENKIISNEFKNVLDVIHQSSMVTNVEYNYEVSPQTIAFINAEIESLLNAQYLDGATSYNNQFWLDEFLRSAYLNGAEDAINSAANVTSLQAGAELTETLRSATTNPVFLAGQMNRAALVGARSFELMQGLTSQTRADLSMALFDGMRRGLGVVELTKNVVGRVGVSHSRATRIVRTEINHSYRLATRSETDAVNKEVYTDSPYELKMLWFSALASTTRKWHASRHGRTYTVRQVDKFYSEDANEINCYCSQTQALVERKTGKVFQGDLMKQMESQKREYFKDDIDDAPPAPG